MQKLNKNLPLKSLSCMSPKDTAENIRSNVDKKGPKVLEICCVSFKSVYGDIIYNQPFYLLIV